MMSQVKIPFISNFKVACQLSYFAKLWQKYECFTFCLFLVTTSYSCQFAFFLLFTTLIISQFCGLFSKGALESNDIENNDTNPIRNLH